MAKANVYLPDHLYAWAVDRDVNMSGMLRGAIKAEKERQDGCAHRHVRCADCGSPLERDDVADVAELEADRPPADLAATP